MTVKESVKALKQTDKALSEIGKELKPFILQLNDDDPAKKAEAQAVVALSVGTLRYMGARLNGKDEGRKPDDPLRQELNGMRKILVALQQKRKRQQNEEKEEEEASKMEEKSGPSLSSESQQAASVESPPKNAPTGKVIDKAASKRMVKAALGISGAAAVPDDKTAQRKRRRKS
uniref:Nuclear nucleic acid-binding protein C1D n=1 Tax=Cyclophora tenuis TaxID=216820 RepID=A0A7S1D8M9_CYCTE|mmetsp:Transcript_3037/g.5152  ORF Transcript_3037/g.5152 Transcript_3037/m.5152 type:complete len:174 (+) Transcript_3037:91-612(+)|eukprot:CAMPEP_0116564212 /NCGR_PEP_ID=MMETSP0397-20121206/13180_1 /TAXON_ID=216820 /ORGANISM="Cyclophora tenuis, Strain ECT3854" /LENGTH=173 /DNA_ID=CAMNT_0004090775 /DNA_START=65 /DNA_END=586 /DNA_ORIENTATION=+